VVLFGEANVELGIAVTPWMRLSWGSFPSARW